MRLNLITAPDGEPVTLEDIKDHARVVGTHDDDILATMIRTARQKLDGRDGFLGRALMTQTWELVLEAFPRREIVLPLVPVAEVLSVKYVDRDGVEQTVAPEKYEIDAADDAGMIVPVTGASWPATTSSINAVKVRFICGYGDAEDVPEPLRQAIRMHATHLYENREAVHEGAMHEVPLGWHEHVAPYRAWSV